MSNTKIRLFVLLLAVTAGLLFLTGEASALVIPEAEMASLVGRAEQSGSVTSAEDVQTTAATALELNPYFVPQGSAVMQTATNVPVAVIVMHGHFVYTMAKMRPGGSPPEGNTMAYTVDYATGEAAVSYVGDRTLTLSGLGTVEHFTASPGSATISRTMHRLPRGRGRRRATAKVATWGNGCKSANNYHCYVIAEWYMHSPEEIEGTQTYQKTTTMNVPGSEFGNFVDMEEWVLFGGGADYPEVGQQGGSYKGCCTVWWFWALTYGKEYFVYENPPYVWEIPYNVYAKYEWKSTNPSTSIWCLFIGPNLETEYACYTGFAIYNKWLEAGGEVATEQKPSFAGSQEVNGEWLGSGVWKGWNFAEYGTYSPKGSAPGLCYGYIGPTPGDMNYGTC
jgi:hypothetical protein